MLAPGRRTRSPAPSMDLPTGPRTRVVLWAQNSSSSSHCPGGTISLNLPRRVQRHAESTRWRGDDAATPPRACGDPDGRPRCARLQTSLPHRSFRTLPDRCLRFLVTERALDGWLAASVPCRPRVSSPGMTAVRRRPRLSLRGVAVFLSIRPKTVDPDNSPTPVTTAQELVTLGAACFGSRDAAVFPSRLACTYLSLRLARQSG
jgi:hypothetical protein